MTTPPANASAGRWILHPAVDLLVGCGAWSLPLLALTFWLSHTEAVYVSFAFYFLGVFCNQPHYMATIYRAYRTREEFNKYRFFTVYVTIFALLTLLVVHLAPGLFPWLLTAYLTWSPWHYTGQNFGISMLLARRAGAQPTTEERNLIWWSYFASYLAWFLALHNSGTAPQATLVLLPIPADLARLAQLFFFLLFLVAGGFGHFRLVRQVGLRRLAGPLTLYVTQFLWFLLPELLHETTRLEFPPTYSSAGILAFMHCAQYLWITTYYERRGAAGTAPTPAAPRFRFGHYYLLLIVGGIALFVPGPWLASRVFGHDLVESFFIFAALINLHHFILDGAIWKLRDGRIARLLLGQNPSADDPTEAAVGGAARPPLGWLFGASSAARGLRYGLGAGLLGIAAVDQTQFWLTLKNSGGPALALAQLLNPSDTRVYFQRAQALAAAGQPVAAMDELRRAIALNPRSPQPQHLLGELLVKSGDTAGALAHYERMAELFRPDLVVLVNSGVLAEQTGDPAKARERLETALRLAPHDTRLHLYLGEALESGGDLPRAIAQYELFTELHAADLSAPDVLPDYLKTGLKLGELYAAQRDRARAAGWYRKVAEIARAHGHPDDAAAAEEKLQALK